MADRYNTPKLKVTISFMMLFVCDNERKNKRKISYTPESFLSFKITQEVDRHCKNSTQGKYSYYHSKNCLFCFVVVVLFFVVVVVVFCCCFFLHLVD